MFREARAAALIDHPNVCTVHEIDEVDGHPFLVRAYVEGQNLEERIVDGALRLVDALNIACQVADGLQAAHQKGVVHGDLKPASIIISTDDTEDARVRIIDGLAQLSENSRLTEPGTPIGTVSYISPEQMNGEAADHRSDIWSFGVILYEMLTGELPFRGEHREAVFYAIAHLAPEPMNGLVAGIPAELERIVSKCLEKDPSRRYQTPHPFGLTSLVCGESRRSRCDSSSEAPNAEIPHTRTEPAGWTLQLESKVAAGRGCSCPDPCGYFASLVFWKAKPRRTRDLRRLPHTPPGSATV